MPCHTIQQSTVVLSESTDLKLFARALEEMGYNITSESATAVTFRKRSTGETGTFVKGGALTINGVRDIDQNAFKRAYSREVVKSTAARLGWKMSEQKPNEFVVQRRF